MRNPFDRFVSYCAFATSREGSFDRDPKRVMRHFLFTARPMNHIIFRPQHLFVTDCDGSLQADMLGKVEEMQASYDAIAARIGLPTTALDHANRSRRGDYRDYYDQQLIDGVAKIYARDLDLFGYDY